MARLTLRPADGAGQQETPSCSSTGSTEALLLLAILSRRDPAPGPLAAEGSPGAPLPEGPGGSRAVPSGISRPAPRCPLGDLPPGPAPFPH